MQIASTSPAGAPPPISKTSEAVESPGADHDSDGDNTNASVKSATAPNVGKAVDVTA